MPKIKPEELKASILQYAIEGRLVEQRAEEGTAEELYKQIQAEKQKLIKEGKIKKEKPLPEISEGEIPFDIPESWKWCRIGDIFSLTMGQSPDGKSVSKNGDGIEFHQGKIFFGENYIQKSDQTTSEPSKIAEANSVLLCVRAPVGVVNITDRDLCIGRGLCSMKPLADMTAQFTLYFARCLESTFVKKATGTTFVAITAEIIKNQLIPLPPLAEQHRIVSKIEELLPYVDRYADAYVKLEEFNAKFPDEMKKSILQYAIEGRLLEQRAEEGTAEELYKQIRAEKQKLIKEGKIKKEKPLPEITEDEIPFDIPESWIWVRLGSIFTLQAGKNITSSDIVDNEDDEHKYLCYGGNGIRGYVKTYNRSGYYVIIGRQGALCGCVNYANGDFYATEHAVVVDHYDITDTKWGGLFLEALNLNQYATATAQPGLSVANINQVLIPLPPLAEQRRIVAKIEVLLPLCERFAECREKA